MRVDAKSLVSGGFFAAIGLFVAATAWFQLDVGTSFQMGPGYFPLLLGGLLALFGLSIALQPSRDGVIDLAVVPWRAVFFIGLAPIAFGLLARGLGLVPTIFLTSLLSAFASRTVGIKRALAVSTGLTVFSVVVFSYGLGLSLRLLGPWLGG